MIETKSDNNRTQSPQGFVLLLTLVLLIIFSSLAYILSSRLLQRRSRNQYMIDYEKAQYACNSAVKYAFATLDQLKPRLLERPNEPDFSDLFQLSEQQYEEFIEEWTMQNQLEIKDNLKDLFNFNDVDDFNDINDLNNISNFEFVIDDLNQTDSFSVRGPYGPPWPLAVPPIEFEIGSANVRIEIEDENAKYPLGWAVLDDKKIEREVMAGSESFFEWMWYDLENLESAAADIDKIKRQLGEISRIKTFKINFTPVTKLERKPVATSRTRTTTRTTARTTRTRTVRTTISAEQQKHRQSVSFAKLFHSSMLDIELLAKPTIESETRKESALKYLGTWGSTKVNINTAPRHVLEAAFIFGGDEVKIANEIILRRRIKPFENIDDLKKELFQYSDSIEKCEKFISTKSTFFTIRIKAVSGVAEASTVIAIIKDGDKTKRIAVASG